MEIQKDKIKHAIVGALIGAVTIWAGFFISALVCFFIAVGKEIYDHYSDGTPDKWDVVATMTGWLPVAMLFELLFLFV